MVAETNASTGLVLALQRRSTYGKRPAWVFLESRAEIVLQTCLQLVNSEVFILKDLFESSGRWVVL